MTASRVSVGIFDSESFVKSRIIMNKKVALAFAAFLGISTLVHANTYSTYNLFNGLNCNNSSYGCNLNIGGGQNIADCTFTFTSCNTSYRGNTLSCDLDGINVNCALGSCKGSTSTWTCTLNQTQLDCLNQCLGSGKCDFNVDCHGNWNIGGCSCNYDCTPKNHNVPDNSTTVVLLGAAIAGVELLRRHLMTPKLATVKK